MTHGGPEGPIHGLIASGSIDRFARSAAGARRFPTWDGHFLRFSRYARHTAPHPPWTRTAGRTPANLPAIGPGGLGSFPACFTYHGAKAAVFDSFSVAQGRSNRWAFLA